MGRTTPYQPMSMRTIVAAFAAVAMLLTLLPSVDAAASPPDRGLTVPEVSGSVEQVAVTGAVPDATITLHGKAHRPVAEGTADAAGSYLFREVEPGRAYRVSQTVDGAQSRRSGPVHVSSPEDTPPASLYVRQHLEPGYGYFEVRDGTKLGYQLLLPDAEVWGEGPYPTVIDYSGYEPSQRFYDGLDRDFLGLGYAVMGVNMRGTGCSGGAFDYFEWLQALDGYDMVETVAAQSWSDGVALVGKSYPGISQLFVAATQPPSLDAIVPGHVVGDYYRDVVYPGGMINQTYAVGWAERQEAIAAYPSGYEWVQGRVGDGDQVCEQNQLLRGQNVGLFDMIASNSYDTDVWQRIAPDRFVDRIEVPTMLVNSWQDDTTGGRPAVLMERFSPETTVRFVGTNGDHGEYYGPAVFGDISRFLAYYLDGEIPDEDADRFSSFTEALSAYETEDQASIHWENGAAGGRVPAFSSTFTSWPIPEVQPWRLHFQPDGSLTDQAPDVASGSTSYTHDPAARDAMFRTWSQPDAETVATWTTPPLTEDTAVAGSASVDLWLASTATDTDLEVLVTEVRPDGKEMYVQTGWLRASHRVEDAERSSVLRPHHLHVAEAAESLTPGEFHPLRVEVFPFAHVFREGSSVKISVEAPGGNRTRWAFGTTPGVATNSIAHTAAMPSSVVLPLVPDVEVETGPPACGTVRSQPCRAAQ